MAFDYRPSPVLKPLQILTPAWLQSPQWGSRSSNFATRKPFPEGLILGLEKEFRVSISKKAAERGTELDIDAMPRDWLVRAKYCLDPIGSNMEQPMTDVCDDLLNFAEWQEGRSERARHSRDD